MVLAGSGGKVAGSRSGRASGRKPPVAQHDHLSHRLSEAEAENQELRQRLAEASARLEEAEELRRRLAEAEALAAGRAALDARLREAEAENEALRRRLAGEGDGEGESAAGRNAGPGPTPAAPAMEAKAARVRIGVGQEASRKGDEALQRGDVEGAIGLYRRGVASMQPLIDGTPIGDGGEEQRVLLEQAAEVEVSLQMGLAQAFIRREDWWATLEAAGTVLDRRPGHVEALYRRGVALARLGQKDSARRDLEEVLRGNPRHLGADQELKALCKGGADADGGNPRSEELPESDGGAMERALARARDVLGAGSLALHAGQLDVALGLLSGGLEVLQSLRRPGEAVEARVEDLEAELYTSVATACLRRHDFQGALEASEQVLRRRPGDPKATLAREAAVERVACEVNAGEEEEEQEQQQRAEGEESEVHEGGDAEPWAKQAAMGAGRGGNAQCRDRLRTPSGGVNAVEVVRTCLTAAQAAKHLGNAALQSGDLNRAAEHYAKSLKMVEVLPLRETAEEFGVDLDDLSDGAALSSSDLHVLKEAADLELALQLNIALVCLKREDFEGTTEAATAVLDRRPRNGKALYRRGVARLRLGLRRGACNDFRALLASEPGMARTVRAHLTEAYELAHGDSHPDWADLFKGHGARAKAGGDSWPKHGSDGTEEDKADEDEGDKDDNEEEEEEDEEDEEDDEDDDDDDDSNPYLHREVQCDSDDEDSSEDVARDEAKNIAEGATGSAADDAEKERAGQQLLRAYEQAQAMKFCGNDHYGKGELQAAQWCYSQGAVYAALATRLSAKEELLDFKGLNGESQQLDVALRLNLTLCLLKLGEFEQAESAASEALKLQPGNAKGLFRRAQANIGRARKAEECSRDSEARQLREAAIVDMRRVVAAEPQNVEARKELAALRAGGAGGGAAPDEAGAQESMSKEASAGSNSPFAGMFGDARALRERHRAAKERRLAEEVSRLREAGNMSHRDGDYMAAEEHYSAALHLAPSNVQLLLNRSAARLMLEEYKEALEDCEKARGLQPEATKAYLRGAKCKQLLGDLEGAEELLRLGLGAVTGATDRDELEAQRRGLVMVSRMLAEISQCLHPVLEGPTEGRRALRLCDELERQKQVPMWRLRPLRLRAILQARDSSNGLGDEAQRLANEVLQQPPPGASRVELLFWKASAYLLVGDRSTAKATLREIATITADTPDDRRPVSVAAAALLSRLVEADAAKDRGNVFFKDRRWEDAVECYEEALRSSRDSDDLSAVLHTNIAAALRKVEQREGDALRHAGRAIEANPRYAKAYFRRGVLHYDAGRWRQSLDDFQRARELEPKLQGLDQWLHRGRHAAREGNERKNHYKALGLQCECEADEIKRRFRLLARECHPDKVRDAPANERAAAEARFKAANEAHEVLSNEKTRKEYDFGAPEPDYGHFGGFRHSHRPQRSRGFGFPRRSSPFDYYDDDDDEVYNFFG